MAILRRPEMDDLSTVERLKLVLIARATNGDCDPVEYKSLRSAVVQNPKFENFLPHFIRTFRTPDEFWAFIQPKFKSYAERRSFLADAFSPLLDYLESAAHSPVKSHVENSLVQLRAETVSALWTKALARCENDPDGAITAARSLAESVCKLILEDLKLDYPTDGDLPKLYGMTANALNLGPSQHSEGVFKRILGGCHTVVENLGALRNHLGDAHGKGRKAPKPLPRHARLAVNLAGAASVFLVETWQARNSNP